MRESRSTALRSWLDSWRGRGRGRPWGLWLLGGSHLGLLLLFDLGAHPVSTLVLLAAGFGSLLLVDRRFAVKCDPAAILLTATLLRLLLLPVPPTLSDDLLRYVWDGQVVNAHLDPYRLAPDAEELAPLRDDLWERLPHRDVPTVYPPLAQAAFSIAARLPWPLVGLKAMLVALDLMTCWMLLGIAGRLGLPRQRTIWYAWNPLVVLEVAGMGHVDALGVGAVVLATSLLVMRPPRAFRAAVAAAGGVLAKLVPLLALPVWARHSRRPWSFLALAAALVALALAPVVVSSGGLPPGLGRYGIEWEFNGPLFEPLWRVLEGVGVAPAVKAGLDRLKEITGHHDFWNRFYPFVYPQLLAKLLLAPGLLGAVWLAWRRADLIGASGIVFASVVLFSATVYPWYMLWVLPFAALYRQPAWLVLSASVLLSYLPQLVDVAYFPLVYLAVWAPFAVFLVRWPRWSID